MVLYHKICKMPPEIRKIPKRDENRPLYAKNVRRAAVVSV